jgi:predicted nucleic acid-binding protein
MNESIERKEFDYVTSWSCQYLAELGQSGRCKRLRIRQRLSEKLGGAVSSLNEDAALQTALILAVGQHIGKPRHLRDTIIAGIALAQSTKLTTRNVRHFDYLSVAVVDHGVRKRQCLNSADELAQVLRVAFWLSADGSRNEIYNPSDAQG